MKGTSNLREAYSRIKRLEIQGARNVAVFGLKSLENWIRKRSWGRKETFIGDLEKAAARLGSARPTEPGLRNGLRYVLSKAKEGKTLEEARELALEAIDTAIEDINSSLERLVKVGVKRIPEGLVLTHCHSSTVTAILKEAWNQGKKFKVMNTETRPRFQGRITARELASHGIPVLHIVDSAARFYMNDVDLVLVGGDAVTADGFLINKIGTSQIMLAAREARTMTSAAVESFKFDPETLAGDWEPIEKRPASEVWKRPPRGVKILNPAFDMTPPAYIDFMITDLGIISPYEARTVIINKWFNTSRGSE